MVHSLKIKSQKEWSDYTKSGEKPFDIPANPRVYKEFTTLGDWLGSGVMSNREKLFLSFSKSKKAINKEKLKNRDEYQSYVKKYNETHLIKLNANPQRKFKTAGWIDWGDFLGTGRTRGSLFLSFNDAKAIVHKLNLNSRKEWVSYLGSKHRHLNLPKDPMRFYKREWKTWDDFLGK